MQAAVFLLMFTASGCVFNGVEQPTLSIPLSSWTETDDSARFLKSKTGLVAAYSFLVHERTIGNLDAEEFDDKAFSLIEQMVEEEPKQYSTTFSVLMHLRNTLFPIIPDNTGQEADYALHIHSNNNWKYIEEIIIEGLKREEEYALAFMAAKEFGNGDSMRKIALDTNEERKRTKDDLKKKILFQTLENMNSLLRAANLPALTLVRGNTSKNSKDHPDFTNRIAVIEKLQSSLHANDYYVSGSIPSRRYENLENNIVDSLKNLTSSELKLLEPDPHYCYSPLYIKSYAKAAGTRSFGSHSIDDFLPDGKFYCNDDDIRNAVYHIKADGLVGTAFQIDKNGYFLTNHHVIKNSIEREFNDITISQFGSGVSRKSVTVLSYDEDRDIALLKATEPFTVDNSRALFLYPYFATLKVGMPVMVFGNPRGEIDKKTQGVITNAGQWVNQEVREMFYHSAETNNGNSGGPVLFTYGDRTRTEGVDELANMLAGLSTAIVRRIEPGAEKMNAAIPMNRVIDHLARFRSSSGEQKKDPWLGIAVGNTAQGEAIITYVFRNSPAERAGLKPGMIITKIQETRVSQRIDLERFLQISGYSRALYRLTIQDRNRTGLTETKEKYIVAEARPRINVALFENDHPGSYIGAQHGFVSYNLRVYYSSAMQKWQPIYVIDKITQEKPPELSKAYLYREGNSFLIRTTKLIRSGRTGSEPTVRLEITLHFVNSATSHIEGGVKFNSLNYESFSYLTI